MFIADISFEVMEFIYEKYDFSETKCTSLDKLRVSRILTEKDMQLYWDRFTGDIFKGKEFMWNITQKCMQE